MSLPVKFCAQHQQKRLKKSVSQKTFSTNINCSKYSHFQGKFSNSLIIVIQPKQLILKKELKTTGAWKQFQTRVQNVS